MLEHLIDFTMEQSSSLYQQHLVEMRDPANLEIPKNRPGVQGEELLQKLPVFLSLSSLSLDAPAPEVPANTHRFLVGGTADPQANLFGSWKDGATVVDYPAEITGFQGDFSKRSHDFSVQEGEKNLYNQIMDYYNNPSTHDNHIQVAGYSLGAEVGHNVLERIAREGIIPSEQISGVLFGDPRRPGGINDGLNNLGLGGLLQAAGFTLKPGSSNFGAIDVQEIAIAGDPIADFNLNGINPSDPLSIFFKGYEQYHLQYGSLFDLSLSKRRNGDIVVEPPRP